MVPLTPSSRHLDLRTEILQPVERREVVAGEIENELAHNGFLQESRASGNGGV
jgi:hypothetical protein